MKKTIALLFIMITAIMAPASIAFADINIISKTQAEKDSIIAGKIQSASKDVKILLEALVERLAIDEDLKASIVLYEQLIIAHKKVISLADKLSPSTGKMLIKNELKRASKELAEIGALLANALINVDTKNSDSI